MATKKQSLSELYATWSKTLTETCIPLLRCHHTLSAAANIATVLLHIDTYYDDLERYADSKTILYVLFPPRRNSPEMPLLFLGDIDPHLLTSFITSLINTNQEQDPHEPYPDPTNYRLTETRIHKIKTVMSRDVDDLTKRVRQANERYVEIFSDIWMLQPWSETVMDTVTASDCSDAKEIVMKEFVSIFLAANRLRTRVIHDIVGSPISLRQKALFLAYLCEFLASFNDQTGLICHQHTIEPENKRMLWMGNVTEEMNEEFLYNCFSQTGQVVSTTCVRDKETGHSKGYGFIEFLTHEAAKSALERYDNTPMPAIGSSSSHIRRQRFRLNWSNKAWSHTIYVGGLSEDVTTSVLRDKFKERYNSVKATKIVMDKETGLISKGYGFVSFGDKSEHGRALVEMNGTFCLGRPMRIGDASRK